MCDFAHTSHRAGETIPRLMNSISIASYNCRGLKLGPSNHSLRYEVEQLLSRCDITCLQETWLSKQDSSDLSGLHMDFNSVSNSPNDDSAGLKLGRRKEGVAIMWHKKHNSYITPCTYEMVKWLMF
jgi:exonuclease III